MHKIRKIIQGLSLRGVFKLSQNFGFLLFGGLLVICQFLYLGLRYSYINDVVPIWYVKPWGDLQLGSKWVLFLIPLMSFIILIGSFLLSLYIRKYYMRYGTEVVKTAGLVSIGFLAASLIRIIFSASNPFPPLVNPDFLNLLWVGVVSFLFVYISTPIFIDYVKKKGIVTNPADHAHPGMVLARPSARGGGFIFMLGVFLTSILFITPSKEILVMYLCAGLLAVFGLLDDYQNTHQKSFLTFLEKPGLRLGFLFLVVLVLIFYGIRIDFISNPFGGILRFDLYTVNLFGLSVAPLSVLITAVWVVWILNLLSWSNGIDAQYCGIIGIAALLTAFLALRFSSPSIEFINLAKIMIIVAGASFGLLPFNWHPSKIMWGFGAMSAGLLVSIVSIMVGSKISISVLVILVPFMDAVVTLVRRVVQHKNPLKGDRGHLHHILLDRGWSHTQIALFYWFTTFIFGVIGIIASDVLLVQTLLILGGLVAGVIIALNIEYTKQQHPDF